MQDDEFKSPHDTPNFLEVVEESLEETIELNNSPYRRQRNPSQKSLRQLDYSEAKPKHGTTFTTEGSTEPHSSSQKRATKCQ